MKSEKRLHFLGEETGNGSSLPFHVSFNVFRSVGGVIIQVIGKRPKPIQLWIKKGEFVGWGEFLVR